MTLSVVDFFCGCGGTSAGLSSLGMDILCGIDFDETALKTYQLNISDALAICTDIRDLSVEELREKVAIPTSGLVLSACAPCQPFSKQNRGRFGNETDTRSNLIDELDRFILALEPDYVLLENVPGLQGHPDSPYARFKKFLGDRSYSVTEGVLNTADYGVAQLRKRLILIASKHGVVPLPDVTHGKGLKPYVSVNDCIERFPPIQAGETCAKTPNHSAAKLHQRNIDRIRMTPEGGDWRDWPENVRLKCHKGVTGYTDTYGRMLGKEPARTLTTRCISYSNGRYGHPTQNRAISGREAAAIQSFDDDFVFVGSLNETARQVGNAVPVRFAAAIGKAVKDHWEGLSNG